MPYPKHQGKKKMKIQTITVLLGLSILLAGSAAADDLQVKWSYAMNNTAKAVVVSIIVSDFNGNGSNEIAIGAKEDRIEGSAGWVYLLNTDGTPKWEQDTPGAISGMIAADLYGDGKKEIITGVSSRVYVFDGNGDYKQVSLGDLTYTAVSIAVEDLNNDGNKEMIIAGGSTEKGKIFIFNKNLALIKETDLLGGPSSMLISDINGDGQKEILVGIIGTNKDLPGYVQAFDSKGDNLWNSNKTKKGVLSLATLDMNGDGSQEILAGSTDVLYVFDSDGKTKDIKNITKPGYEYNTIKVSDLNGDGIPEVILGCTNTVYLLDRTLTDIIWKNPVGTEVFDIKTEDMNGNGSKEIAIASDKLYIFNKDGTYVNGFDAKTPTNQLFSVRDIYIGDINEDKYPEILIGSTDGKVYALTSTTQATRMDANNEYKKARDQYAASDYDDADTSAQNAIKLYRELGDSPMVQNLTDLRKHILNEQLRTENQSADAQAYLDSANDAFKSGNYTKTIENAKIAKAKYMDINPADPRIQECGTMINNSLESLRLESENYLNNATQYLENKDYQNALAYSQKAYDDYAFLAVQRFPDTDEYKYKDSVGLEKSQSILNESKQVLGVTDDSGQEQQAPKLGPDISSLLPVLVILIVVIIVAGIYIRSKKQKEKKKDN